MSTLVARWIHKSQPTTETRSHPHPKGTSRVTYHRQEMNFLAQTTKSQRDFLLSASEFHSPAALVHQSATGLQST